MEAKFSEMIQRGYIEGGNMEKSTLQPKPIAEEMLTEDDKPKKKKKEETKKKKATKNKEKEPAKKKKKKESDILPEIALMMRKEKEEKEKGSSNSEKNDFEEDMGVKQASLVLQKSKFDREALWRVNFEKFMIDFRNRTITDWIKWTFVDKGAKVMMQAMLEFTSASITNHYSEKSCKITQNKFEEYVRNNWISLNIAEELLPAAHLYYNLFKEKKLIQDNMLNFKGIMEEIRLFHINVILRKKFGILGEACQTIFALLLDKKFLEVKQIAEKALLNPTIARTSLYKLMEQGFLFIQEVPKTLEQRIPSKTIHLFGLDMNVVKKNLCEQMFKTVFNILYRFDSQKRSILPLLNKVEHSLSMDCALEDTLNFQELADYNHYLKVSTTFIPFISSISSQIDLFN